MSVGLQPHRPSMTCYSSIQKTACPSSHAWVILNTWHHATARRWKKREVVMIPFCCSRTNGRWQQMLGSCPHHPPAETTLALLTISCLVRAGSQSHLKRTAREHCVILQVSWSKYPPMLTPTLLQKVRVDTNKEFSVRTLCTSRRHPACVVETSAAVQRGVKQRRS